MSIFFGLIFIPLQIIHQLSHYSTEERKELIAFPKRRGQRTVVCSFNLSLFLILLWALMMCKVISNKYIYIFIPTFIFALLLFHYMRRLMTTKKIDAAYAYKIRLLFRKICIGYGIIIFFIYFLLPRP
jgi:membrane-bound acyltransferase YfiQ involved in biofilm formation